MTIYWRYLCSCLSKVSVIGDSILAYSLYVHSKSGVHRRDIFRPLYNGAGCDDSRYERERIVERPKRLCGEFQKWTEYRDFNIVLTHFDARLQNIIRDILNAMFISLFVINPSKLSVTREIILFAVARVGYPLAYGNRQTFAFARVLFGFGTTLSVSNNFWCVSSRRVE